MSSAYDDLWKRQSAALRDPLDIYACTVAAAGISDASLRYQADRGFSRVLRQLDVTLYVSREYENLLVALSAPDGRVEQTFLPLPHPSGIATDRTNGKLYVAATRNPNQILEFTRESTEIPRSDRGGVRRKPCMRITRKKFYPGCYYFHDLALVGGRLFANAVGMNGVVRINFATSQPEPLAWFPRSVETSRGKADSRANYLQLNSIAAGKTIAGSFFSASTEAKGYRRPGHLDFPVDKRGVIFSGRTREPVCRGLTRPHSARLHQGRLWVDNSGYGEFGFVQDGRLQVVAKLPGWTRGLCLLGDIAFVGVSRIIPKFRRYAPGITGLDQICSIYALDIKDGLILGKIEWPAGNQIFAIDYLNNAVAGALSQKTLASSVSKLSAITYSFF